VWAKNDRTSSIIARCANIANTLLSSIDDIVVTRTVHVPGDLNVVWDGLTREKSAASVDLPPELQIFFPPDHPVVEFIALCDPALPLDTYTQHVALSNSFIRLLTDPAMSLPHPIPNVTA
jgi:hypothetical protein